MFTQQEFHFETAICCIEGVWQTALMVIPAELRIACLFSLARQHFKLSQDGLNFICYTVALFGRIRITAQSDNQLRHVCPPACPQGATQLLLDGFL